MHITGTATLNAPAATVWKALLDPAVLARTLPGVTRLETIGPEHYRGTIEAGVAAIKGTFDGEVQLTDLKEPESLVLRASGAGAPGTVQADVAVTLKEVDGGRTELSYDAQAVIGGTIGGVGQRVLTGVSKKMAGEFFSAVNAELQGTAPRPAAAESARAEAGAAAAAAPAVYQGRTAEPRPTGGEFVRGAVFGAAIALAGVVVGALAAGRRRR